MKIKILLLVFLGLSKINCADISDSVKKVKIVNNTDIIILLTCPAKLGANGFGRLKFNKGTSCIQLKKDQMDRIRLVLNNVYHCGDEYILCLSCNKDTETIIFNQTGVIIEITFKDAANNIIGYQTTQIKSDKLKIEDQPDLPKKDIPAINSDSEIKNSNSDQFNLKRVFNKKNKKLLSVASLITGIALYAWIKKSPKKEDHKKDVNKDEKIT